MKGQHQKTVRALLGSVREYKKPSLLCPVFVVLEVLMEVLVPGVMALMIDKGMSGGSIGYILKIGAVLLVMSMMALVFGILAGTNAARASAGMARNLRKDMFHHIQEFSFSNIDRFSPSSLVTRLTTDITNVQNAYQMVIRIAIRGPIMLCFALIMAMEISRELSTIFFIVLPILAAGLFYIVIKAHPYFEAVFKRYDVLNRVVQENLNAIRVVKSFVRQDTEISKFNVTAREVQRLFTNAERYIALNNPLMQICVYGIMVFLLTVGSKLIITTQGQALDIGQFSTLLTYSFQILGSLMMLSMIFVLLTFTEESVKRVEQVLHEQSDLVSPPDPETQVRDGSIVFDHAYFQYDAQNGDPVLEDINLDIHSGEVIGIVGGTGSGKSSLVQLIPRLYDVTDGAVAVGGLDVRRYDLETLRSSVAMVLQKNLLFSGTVADNIRWGNENATDEEVRQVCEWACADEFIQRFPDGYNTWIEQGGANVSGGQKQRICIARALLKKPKILILDDSTSAVDTKTDAAIRQALRDFLPGTTKLIIAQRLASVENADRIIVMDKGKINAVGTSEELLQTNTIYQEMARSQNLQKTDEKLAQSGAEKGGLAYDPA